ncbi:MULTISPECIES: Eco57I restriction-modification methylase domain-containing protein [Micromonospora]|uniref:site-specific DNA-methyltransferase (adenine-specific) n=1 Tax=Micromonospora sicca TaxID=2202420 RepID=A0A317DET2_9ACTN|nr:MULTISPECIES: DNA methyltransferase [unclassified Micromonospora]MBM0226674.1 N-6 DNA methylase [Micromonospora sp. ATA51]PWR11235.1 restriction endonuclease [Micromonospora sp. 4G51]
MSATARNQVFSTVHTIGGLLPAEMLVRISQGKDVTGSRPADYRVVGSRSVRDDAERHWAFLKSIWEELREKLPGTPEAETPADPTGIAITQWLEPLFAELGFGSLTAIGASGIAAGDGGKTFPISHRWNHVPIHLVVWNASLDKRPAGGGSVSPQSLLQEFLNRSEAHLWGVLTNGRQVRLLRDSSALATASYVEFDLEAIFDGELFSEFVLLYRLLHVSRFEVVDGAAATCWLEMWRTEAIQTGIRALKHIRSGVQEAVAALASGFLKHPANGRLREGLDADALQHALLRFVYRLLFVFVAEDRGILHTPSADAEARERYHRYFSTARLRRVARHHRGGPHTDLYQALSLVLDGLARDEGRPELGLPALGGIFEESDTDRLLAGLSLSNEALLSAVRQLSQVKDKTSNRYRTIDYRNLGAEELGSIYEFLLELRLTPSADMRSARMVEVAGNARKTTGSFYTHSAIIECLLDSALDPVLDDAVRRGLIRATASDGASQTACVVDELLKVSVCDPACGSGHFLVAAARRIAKRIAAVREGSPEPTPNAVRSAMWEVVTHCIYGVDLNPMAVELAKVSLWLEALKPGKPLGFLDAHIKQGNALVGATPALLAQGIPTDAFAHVEGDEVGVVSGLRAINKREREGHVTLFLSDNEQEISVSNAAFADEMHSITTRKTNTLSDVREQSVEFQKWLNSPAYLHAVHVADAWCSSFFWKKTADAPRPVTQEVFRALAERDGAGASAATRHEIVKLARRYSFFHWHLEFPEIFQVADNVDRDATGETGWTGGFSCVLGNPPWDSLSPDEKEFFSTYNTDVRAMKRDARETAIADLLESPVIRERWDASRRDLYALVHFLKRSGRYRLFAQGNLGKGDFNVYRMFVESALTLTANGGAATQVTPSNIYNGANAQAIRAELFDHWDLRLMLGFINTGEEWFDGADGTMRFGAYSARRAGRTSTFSVGFQIKNPTDLATALKSPPRLSVEVVRSQSPDALAIGDTVGGTDSEVTDHLYRQWPAFSTISHDFPHRVYQREIDMGNDRDRYTDEEPGLSLFEGRMVGQYDHRAKAYVSGRGRSAVWDELEFGSPKKAIVPQWVVPQRNIPNKTKGRISQYRIGFCGVTAPRNERSLVAALIPPQVICGHSVPTIYFGENFEWAYPLWLGAANSMCLDFLARKKVTLNMQLGVLDSLPFPRLRLGDPLLDRLAPLVLRLTCTSPEMTPFWNRMGEFGWTSFVPEEQVPSEALVDDASRAEAQAEIDAVVAKHLFNLDRRQLEYILTTFPTLERKERRKYGDYRTRALVLRAFDKE